MPHTKDLTRGVFPSTLINQNTLNKLTITEKGRFMPRKEVKKDAPSTESDPSSCTIQSASCCRVDALIAIDGRGQIVLPKDIRKRAGIEAGDKLAVISWESDGQVCCLSLIKADEFGASIKGLLGPMMEEILKT